VLYDRPKLNPSIAWGYGSVISTASDMAKFIEAVNEGKLLSEEYEKEFFTAESALGGALQMGLGIMYVHSTDTQGHIGQVVGFDAAMQYQVTNKAPIVALSNRTLAHGGKINSYVVQSAIYTLYGIGSGEVSEGGH